MQKIAWYRWFNEESLQHLASGCSWFLLILAVILCITFLSKGANWLIDGVVDLGRRSGLPEIVIGATIVSIGTTMPEAMVSVMAAWMGNPGLALGNGVGSIIADTGLIFGLSCIMISVPINRYILNRTGWVQFGVANLLVASSIIAYLISAGEPYLPRTLGIFFLALLLAYLWVTYKWAKNKNDVPGSTGSSDDEISRRLSVCWLMIIGGLMVVLSSARILIPTASELALRLGVPDDVIAATVVAFGTSLPELMTALTAVRKGHPDIVVGNVVGADVLNCLFVIGAAAIARPLFVPNGFYVFHFPAMLIILWSFRLFITFSRYNYFKKWQGIWLLSAYFIYIVLQYRLNIGG